MNTRHFLKKGDITNEEVYQIFGSLFDSKEIRNSSSSLSTKSVSLPSLTSSAHQIQGNQTISIKDNEEEDEEIDESRFCHITVDCNCKADLNQRGKVMKDIKVDYFQLAHLSRKFQKMTQFFNFPYIKRFKYDKKISMKNHF